jgi:hypothetical protein
VSGTEDLTQGSASPRSAVGPPEDEGTAVGASAGSSEANLSGSETGLSGSTISARERLLAFRSFGRAVPTDLVDLRAAEDETGWRTGGVSSTAAASGERPGFARSGSGAVSRAQSDRDLIIGSRFQSNAGGDRRGGGDRRDRDRRGNASSSSAAGGGREKEPAIPMNFRRPVAPTDRMDELKRGAMSLLNKVAPDTIESIAAKIAGLNIGDLAELELVIGCIMKKALTEPHYCETYADLVYRLKGQTPEFQVEGHSKPVGLKSALLNICQTQFEDMQRDSLELSEQEAASLDPAEVEFQRSQRKKTCLAQMKFLGHLFLRQLLTAKIIGQIIYDLAMCDSTSNSELPAEHIVECICELLNSIGYTMDSLPVGKEAVRQVCLRLLDLKQMKDPKTGKSRYSKRIQFAIQDLHETRHAGWTKKVFKAAAKTKQEIADDQRRDEANGKAPDGSERILVGARPSYIVEGQNQRNAAAAGGASVEQPWQEVTAGKSR